MVKKVNLTIELHLDHYEILLDYLATTAAPVGPFVPKWDVQKQDGIGEGSKTTILSSLRTLIDTYGKHKKPEIAMDMKLWLDKSYGGDWAVVIGDNGQYGSAFSYVANTCMVVIETTWSWRIVILRTA